jgi:dTMP kinase
VLSIDRGEWMGMMSAGALIAFEGLDQSGKQTQAELLRDWLKQEGRKARLVSFPDYGTSIGEEIARALQGEREYGPDVMQLLYIANRYERKPDLLRWLDGGLTLVCDRYMASSVAYGEAQGLDPDWLAAMQRFLPQPALTIMLDIAPETAVQRKAVDRDRYERDLAMQGRVRESYRRQAEAGGWVVLEGEQSKDAIASGVLSAVESRLGLR